MSTTASIKSESNDLLPLHELIVDAIADIKGEQIVLLDLTHLDDRPSDYFIICQGDSTTQVNAIAGNIYRRLKEEMNEIPGAKEGLSNASWVLLDYFNTVVHVFYKDTRKFYDLEQLWQDARITMITEPEVKN